MKRHCPNCNKITDQILNYYSPDDSENGLLEVWECEECHEAIDFVGWDYDKNIT